MMCKSKWAFASVLALCSCGANSGETRDAKKAAFVPSEIVQPGIAGSVDEGSVARLALAARASSLEAEVEPPPSMVTLPAATPNILSVLVQTAAVVQGTVAAIESDYTEESGPWTNIRLSEVVVHRGRLVSGAEQPTKVVLRQKGGVFPDGRVLRLSHQAEFVRNKRYVVLLRNTGWFLSPVVGGAAFRVEREGQKEVLVGQDEGVILSISSSGFGVSEPLYEKEEGATFRYAPRKRIVERAIPSAALDVEQFVDGLDRELIVRGLVLSGTFYDEPMAKARITPLAAKPGEPSSQAKDDDSPSVPEQRPGLNQVEAK